MMTRRHFLEATLALTVASRVQAATSGARPAAAASGVPRRKLGRTGETVSILGLGGAHIGTQAEAESVRLIRAAVDGGVTFLDNCWDYHRGQSELRMGKALRDGYRDRVFLMTKVDGRDARTATRQLEESLRRLQTDRLDLLQLHEVIHADDARRAFAAGGAIEALVAAQKAGKARFLGFTGHKSPELHLQMLQAAREHGFRFDAVQMPLNLMDAHYESFEKRVLPVLLEDGVAVLGMKPLGGGYLLESKAATAAECLQYALSLPTSVVITGIDSTPVLEQDLKVARGFRPLSEEQVQALLARTAPLAKRGDFEKYKTSNAFDSTVRNPEWLGPGKG